MSMLAEIGDKMGSVPGMFVTALVLAVLTTGLGAWRWWLALPSVALACLGNVALVQDMQSLWDGIMDELGWSWVIGSFAAWNGASGLCWCGLFAIHRWATRATRLAEGLCMGCGYNLTGNLSGVCPECGEQITL